MEFKWFKSIAKTILMALVIVLIFNAVYAVVCYSNAVKAVENRLQDLAIMVAEDNILENDTGTNSSYKLYCGMLTVSETPYLHFHPTNNFAGWGATRQGTHFGAGYGVTSQRQWAVLVKRASNVSNIAHPFPGDGFNTDQIMSHYAGAPQRGTPIVVAVRAKFNVPIMLVGSILPTTFNTIEIERSYIVMGTRFYKSA